MKDRFSPGRLGDWAFFCDICGSKCWASETTVLNTYTGRGGLRVCPSCTDPIDYGLVPYKIPAERPVPFAKDTVHSGDIGAVYQKYPSFDPELYDWTVTPDQLIFPSETWDEITFTWGQDWAQYKYGDEVALGDTGLPGGEQLDEDGDPQRGGFNP